MRVYFPFLCALLLSFSIPALSSYLVVLLNNESNDVLALIDETTGNVSIAAEIPLTNHQNPIPAVIATYHSASNTYYALLSSQLLFVYNTVAKTSKSIPLLPQGLQGYSLYPLCVSQSSGALYILVTWYDIFGDSYIYYYAQINLNNGQLTRVTRNQTTDNNAEILYNEGVQCVVDDANSQILTSTLDNSLFVNFETFLAAQLTSDDNGNTTLVSGDFLPIFTVYISPFKQGVYYAYYYSKLQFGTTLAYFTSTTNFTLEKLSYFYGLTSPYATINVNEKALCTIVDIKSIEAINLDDFSRKSLPLSLPPTLQQSSSQPSSLIWFSD